MSKKGRRPRKDLPEPDPEHEGSEHEHDHDNPGPSDVWIHTQPDVLGETYLVTVSVGSDYTQTFTPEEAVQYAHYLSTVLARAEYDAAVIKQLTSRGLEKPVAAHFVVDLRDERPDLDDRWILVATPFVGFRTGLPGVTMSLNPAYCGGRDDELGAWEADQVRDHINHMLASPQAADLDAAYLRMLKGVIGLDDGVARAVVGSLDEYREK